MKRFQFGSILFGSVTAVSIDPYQVLFPLGLVHGVLGTIVWIFFALNLIPYPGLNHPHYMITGFLFSFAAGFMMTAIPRFTGAARSSSIELFLATALSILSLFLTSAMLTLGMLVFISSFFARRVLTRTFTPPPHFLFLPIGLFFGILGSSILSFVELGWLDSTYVTSAKIFLYHGTMLAFLLGIGAKLISALLGWAEPPVHRIEPLTSNVFSKTATLKRWIIPCAQAALFVSSIGIEVFFSPTTGRAIKAICASWIAIQNWHLFQLPKAPGKLAFWIWSSAWLLILGLWSHCIFPEYGVHAAHLIFISGFGLITLLVASRVTLAHGGYPVDLESKSRIFAATSVLIGLAAFTRVASPWTPSVFLHFGYAAGLWIIALCSWGLFFLPKMAPKQNR